MQRHVTIDLTPEEYKTFSDYVKSLCTWCKKPTLSEILHGFIGDLTDTADSGGSDERMMANDYIQRRWCIY